MIIIIMMIFKKNDLFDCIILFQTGKTCLMQACVDQDIDKVYALLHLQEINIHQEDLVSQNSTNFLNYALNIILFF